MHDVRAQIAQLEKPFVYRLFREAGADRAGSEGVRFGTSTSQPVPQLRGIELRPFKTRPPDRAPGGGGCYSPIAIAAGVCTPSVILRTKREPSGVKTRIAFFAFHEFAAYK